MLGRGSVFTVATGEGVVGSPASPASPGGTGGVCLLAAFITGAALKTGQVLPLGSSRQRPGGMPVTFLRLQGWAVFFLRELFVLYMQKNKSWDKDPFHLRVLPLCSM